MNTPSKPPPFANSVRIMQTPLGVKKQCQTCGKLVDVPGANLCNNCWDVERRLEVYAQAINGRIKLKKAVEKAERELRELAARASKVVR